MYGALSSTFLQILPECLLFRLLGAGLHEVTHYLRLHYKLNYTKVDSCFPTAVVPPCPKSPPPAAFLISEKNSITLPDAQAKCLESPSLNLSPSPLESNQSQAWWHPRQHRSGLLLYCPNWLPCFCPLCPIFISKTTVRMILWKSKSGDVTLLNTHQCSHGTNT